MDRIIRILVISLCLLSFGCADYCEDRLRSSLVVAQYADESEKPEHLSSLESTLKLCKIPKGGIEVSSGHAVHASLVFFHVGDKESAAEALRSHDYTLSDDQKYELLSYAAGSSDAEVLEIVLDAGIDPTMRQPVIGNTVLMDATGLAAESAERMQYLVKLGIDPLAENVYGFSALDSAVAVGNDEAVHQMLEWIYAGQPGSLRLVRRAISTAHTIDDKWVKELERWLKTNESGGESAADDCAQDLRPIHQEKAKFPYWTFNTFVGTAKLAATVQSNGEVVNPRVTEISDWIPITTGRSQETDNLTEPLGYENAILDAVSRYKYPSGGEDCSILLTVQIDQEYWNDPR